MSYDVLIDKYLCIGCRFCAVKCPTEVLDLRNESVAFVSNIDKCIGCRICEQCPEDAITVIGE